MNALPSRSVRRLLLLLAIAATVGFGVVLLANGAGAHSTVAAPEDQARAKIVSAGQCGVIGDVLLVDEPVTVDQGYKGMLRAGLYVGNLADAVVAFGGELVASDEDEAWITIKDALGQVTARQLRHTYATGGEDVWRLGNILKATTC